MLSTRRSAKPDPEIAELLDSELGRQRSGLEMIASENLVPSERYCNAGLRADQRIRRRLPRSPLLWRLRIRGPDRNHHHERAKALFGAKYANVQPHSGAQANAVYQALEVSPATPCSVWPSTTAAT